MNHSTPGLPVYHQLPEITQTHVHQVGDAIQPSHPPSSPFSSCPQSVPASGSFPMSQLMRWSKYWSFSFSISPSNEHPGLIPFRMNWLDLLAVQGTLKSLLHQICVYLWLIHVYACQKPAQPCKAIILQLKINKLQNIDKYKLPSTS